MTTSPHPALPTTALDDAALEWVRAVPARLAELPLAEHAGALEEAHRLLVAALATLDAE